MENFSGNTIFEEREALMVSATGRIPTLRTAHFIKPIANSITSPNLKLPFLPLCSETSWPLSVSFNGWYDSLKKWPTWVNKMKSKHEVIWKKSGIYDTILASTYRIRRNSELIFGVAERWCSQTNSFLFPWGEATITLEDMMVLGGFSVLGHPFSMPLETKELVKIQEGLEKLVKSLAKSKKRDANHCEWMDFFMDSGDDLEHEAFLSLWLSRFVLPSNVFDAIDIDNISIAIYLARGIRIALAPVVLASLYRDLSLLKETILFTHEVNVDENESNNVEITLWSPIQFVQIWAWERLPALQPKPKVISPGEPRLARWHGVNWLKRLNLRLVIDSAGESFLWRPYAIAADNWLVPEFYKDEEEWVSVDGTLSEELESFARCLRVSELVGTESIEAYLPHRVAMQFGMDQDLPHWIPKSNETHESAWENYIRPFCDAKLYFPNRLFEADVTKRYIEWWEKSVLDLQGEIKGLLRGTRSLRPGGSRGLPRKSYWGKGMSQIWNENSTLNMVDINDMPLPAIKDKCLTSLKESTDPDTPPGFPPKSVMEKERLRTSNKYGILDWSDIDTKPLLLFEKNSFITSIEGDDPGVPPGFPPKYNRQSIQNRLGVDVKPFVAVENHSLPSLIDGNSDDFPLRFTPKHNQANEMVQTCGGHNCKSRLIDNNKPVMASKKQRLCSQDNGGVSSMIGNLSKPMVMAKQSEATIRQSKPDGKTANNHNTKSQSPILNGGGINYDAWNSFLETKLEDFDIETHIRLHESVLARLKAARSEFRYKCVKKEPES